jgi:hypothetical protein
MDEVQDEFSGKVSRESGKTGDCSGGSEVWMVERLTFTAMQLLEKKVGRDVFHSLTLRAI